ALCGVHRRGAPLMGLDIVGLYLAAATQYGVYHLLDYLAFPGMAYFLVASHQGSARWMPSRLLVWQMIEILAELERSLIHERTTAGRAAAVARGASWAVNPSSHRNKWPMPASCWRRGS